MLILLNLCVSMFFFCLSLLSAPENTKVYTQRFPHKLTRNLSVISLPPTLFEINVLPYTHCPYIVNTQTSHYSISSFHENIIEKKIDVKKYTSNCLKIHIIFNYIST